MPDQRKPGIPLLVCNVLRVAPTSIPPFQIKAVEETASRLCSYLSFLDIETPGSLLIECQLYHPDHLVSTKPEDHNRLLSVHYKTTILAGFQISKNARKRGQELSENALDLTLTL